jgi:hypothetical protein
MNNYSHQIENILYSRVLLPPRLVPNLLEAHDAHGHKEIEADKKMLLFSENQVWEPSSYRGVIVRGMVVDLHKVEDYERVGIRIYRIRLDRSTLKPWARLKTLARVSVPMAQELERSARELGSNPYDWFGTLLLVPMEKWQAFEALVDREWRPVKRP